MHKSSNDESVQGTQVHECAQVAYIQLGKVAIVLFTRSEWRLANSPVSGQMITEVPC